MTDKLEAKAQLDERNRECLIFEARGRQLQEAQQQIVILKEEIAQCERVNHRKEILAKGIASNSYLFGPQVLSLPCFYFAAPASIVYPAFTSFKSTWLVQPMQIFVSAT